MNDQEYNSSLEPDNAKKTESYKKMMNYMLSLIEDSDFREKVDKIRKKFKIPIKSFSILEYPEHLRKTNFSKEVENLSSKYSLDSLWSLIIENYVLFSDFNATEIFPGLSAFEIVDLNFFLNGPFDKYLRKEIASINLQYVKDMVKTKPIAILIHPYASQRSIIDYIKKLYKSDIMPLQINYKSSNVKLEKIRGKRARTKEIHQYIYDNRDLPRKEIISLVATKFGPIFDATYISKIISAIEKSQ